MQFARTPLAWPTSIFRANSENSDSSMRPELSTSYNPKATTNTHQVESALSDASEFLPGLRCNLQSTLAARSPGITAKQAWQYSWYLTVGVPFQAQNASKWSAAVSVSTPHSAWRAAAKDVCGDNANELRTQHSSRWHQGRNGMT